MVDNNSADGSSEMVRTGFEQVKLIANSANLGFAAANNQAMREARGDLVLLLNPDTDVQPGSIATLLQFLAHHPRGVWWHRSY